MVEDVVESLNRNPSRAGSYHMTFSGGPCVGTRASAMMVCPACFKVTKSRADRTDRIHVRISLGLCCTRCYSPPRVDGGCGPSQIGDAGVCGKCSVDGTGTTGNEYSRTNVYDKLYAFDEHCNRTSLTRRVESVM